MPRQAGSVRGDVVDRWKHLRGAARDFAPSCFHSASTDFAEARFWKPVRA